MTGTTLYVFRRQEFRAHSAVNVMHETSVHASSFDTALEEITAQLRTFE